MFKLAAFRPTARILISLPCICILNDLVVWVVHLPPFSVHALVAQPNLHDTHLFTLCCAFASKFKYFCAYRNTSMSHFDLRKPTDMGICPSRQQHQHPLQLLRNTRQQSIRARRNWHHLVQRISRVLRLRRKWAAVGVYLQQHRIKDLVQGLERHRGHLIRKRPAATQ